MNEQLPADPTGGGERRARVSSHLPAHLPALGALLCALVSFAPWGRSGSRVRSSYEIVDVVDRAGILDDPWAALAPVWLVIPALAGVSLLAAALARPRIAAAAGATLGALVGTGGVLVIRSPLITEAGATAAIVLGTLTTIVGVLALVIKRKDGIDD